MLNEPHKPLQAASQEERGPYEPPAVASSADSGSTWTQQANAGTASWCSLDMSADGSVIVAAPSYAAIKISKDGGLTWTDCSASGSRGWQSVSCSSDGTKIAAAVWSGYIYTSTDSGTTWTSRANDTSRMWESVAMTASGTRVYGVARGLLDVFCGR